MGFKRTTEGRVYFQKSGTTANDDTHLNRADTIREQALHVGQQAEFEILSLLKSLNERLKATQEERIQMRAQLDEYRTVIEDLEFKSDKTERAYLSLQRQIEDGAGSASATMASGGAASGALAERTMQAEKMTREAVRKLEETRQALAALEAKAAATDKNISLMKQAQEEQTAAFRGSAQNYTALAGRMEKAEYRQETLSDQMESTLSQQRLLIEKVDQVAEDRARFMRKIERIEEAVLQTRDSLAGRLNIMPNMIEDRSPLAGAGLTGQELPEALLAGGRAEARRASILIGDENLPENNAEQGRASYEQPFAQPAARENQAFAAPSASAAPVSFLRGFLPSAMPYMALGAMAIVAGWLIVSAVQNQGARDSAALMPSSPQSVTQQRAGGDGVALAPAPSGWEVQTDTSGAFAENAEPGTGTDTGEAFPANRFDRNSAVNDRMMDDIGTVDLMNDQEVMRALDGGMDDIAAGLNAIEPGTDPAEKLDTQATDATRGMNDVLGGLSSAQEEAQQTIAAIPPASAPSATTLQPNYMKPDVDLPAVITQVERQAIAGDAEAQHDLGAVYTAGHGGVKQDFERAAFWFGKAAQQGVANAQYNLGVLYHQGLGVKPDIKQAINNYDKAAAQGHPEAQYNLGIAYIEGIGVAYNPKKAVEYFDKAAGQGVMEAEYNLGLIYENGLLGKAEPEKALRYYKDAADKGSPEAKAALNQLAKTLNIKPEQMNNLMQGLDKTGQAALSSTAQKKTLAGKAAAPDKSATAATADPVSLSPAQKKTSSARTSGASHTNARDEDNQSAIDNLVAAPETTGSRGGGVRVTRLDNAATATTRPSVMREEQILLAQVQEQLMISGLFPGPADGVMNAMTADAIRSYQARNGMPATGIPTGELLAHMLR